MTVKVPTSFCPYCNHKLDRATAVDGTDVSPKPSDLTICLHCAALLVFDNDLKVRGGVPSDLLDVDVFTLRELARAKRNVIQVINSRN